MKDFAKSIVCNVKAEVAKVGNGWNTYSVRWTEFNSRDQLVTKQKDFATEKAMEKFIENLSKKDNFNQVEATSYPSQNSKVGNKSNYRYKGFLITFSQDGIHVFLQNGYTVAYGPTGSEEKARDWCDWHDPKTNKPVAEFRNSKIGNNAFQEKTLQYAYEKAKSKGLSGKALEDETLRIATHAAPYASSAHSDSLRREVQEFLLKAGNSKTGNADPRIASLKSKIKQNKDDIGALKDVYYLADDMVKELTARKKKLMDDVHAIEQDLGGWIDLRSEVKFMI